MTGFVCVPGAKGSEGFIELSRTKQGKLFRKHILSKGELHYPGVAGGKVNIDDSFMSTLVTNFSNKVCDIVQVPKAGAKNEHTEDPDRNIGEVVDLKVEDDKVYAYIDARVEEDANKLGKTLLGASAMMHLDYTDTKTNTKAGPTLLHVAVTNRPYITELEEFEEVLAASAEGHETAVLLTAPTQEVTMPTRAEAIEALKKDHGIDVAQLEADAAKGVELSNTIKDLGTAGVIKLSNGEEASVDDIVGSIATLAEKNVELSNTLNVVVEEGRKKAAEDAVDKLITASRILPADREHYVELRLSNADLFDKLVPAEGPKLVNLSQEQGSDVEVSLTQAAQETIDRIAGEYIHPASR